MEVGVKVDFARQWIEYWSVEDLTQLVGFDILYLEMTSICLFNLPYLDMWSSDFGEIISKLLLDLNPREIDLTREGCCRFTLTKKQILEIKDLHITGFSTVFLEERNSLQPVEELNKIKDLEIIILKSGTRVSLKLLEKFDIKDDCKLFTV